MPLCIQQSAEIALNKVVYFACLWMCRDPFCIVFLLWIAEILPLDCSAALWLQALTLWLALRFCKKMAFIIYILTFNRTNFFVFFMLNFELLSLFILVFNQSILFAVVFLFPQCIWMVLIFVGLFIFGLSQWQNMSGFVTFTFNITCLNWVFLANKNHVVYRESSSFVFCQITVAIVSPSARVQINSNFIRL